MDHTGRNNAFECASMTDKALRYNDESVLENHHCSCLYTLIRKDETNILKNISNEDFKYIRRMTISSILSTDMKKHFEIIPKFSAKVNQYNVLNKYIIIL